MIEVMIIVLVMFGFMVIVIVMLTAVLSIWGSGSI